MDWLEYLDGVTASHPEDISLFPYVDEEEDTARMREKMLKARFRWLKEYRCDVLREDLYTEWRNDDLLIESRRSDRHVDLHDFYNRSEHLGLHLLRVEVSNLSYYKQLRDALKTRIRRDTPVIVFGPTSGAEAEAVTEAGGSPKVVAFDSNAPWVHQLHERMFHDSQEYEVYTYDEFARNALTARYIVLSNFIPDIPGALRLAKQHVGSYGFVLFSAENKCMMREAEELGLFRVDEHRDAVAVEFKHRALSEG